MIRNRITIFGFLVSLLLTVNGLSVVMAQPSPKELSQSEIKNIVDSVMGDDEFRSVRSSMSDEKGFLVRWLEDLNEWLTEIFDSDSERSRSPSGGAVSLGSSMLLTVVLVALVIFIAVLIVFTIRSLENDPTKKRGLDGLLGNEDAVLPSTPPG